MKKVIFSIVIVYLYSFSVYGLSYLGINNLPDSINFYGVRSLGMGCTGIASSDDYSAILGNPAALYNVKDIIFGIGGRIMHNSEHIMSFESSAYFDSSFTGLNVLTAFISGQLFEYLSFGFGMLPIYDLNYKSEHSIPEISSYSYGTKSIESDGSITLYGGAFSINIPDLFSVGFGAGVLSGGKTLVQKIVYDNNTYGVTGETSEEYSYSGFKMNMGVYIPFTKQFSIGGRLDLGYDLSEKKDEIENIYSIPMSIGGGFVYKNFIRYDTQFAFDVIYSKWSKYEVKYGSSAAFVPNGARDTISYRMGVEHLVGKSKRNSIPVRIGYYYEPYPLDPAYDISAVTVGLGFPYRPMMFNISMEYGKRSYRGDNAFFDADKLIDESLINVEFTIDYIF